MRDAIELDNQDLEEAYNKGKSEVIKVMEEVIYDYPPEFLLECEYEANARDVLNDIVQRIKSKIGELAK